MFIRTVSFWRKHFAWTCDIVHQSEWHLRRTTSRYCALVHNRSFLRLCFLPAVRDVSFGETKWKVANILKLNSAHYYWLVDSTTESVVSNKRYLQTAQTLHFMHSIQLRIRVLSHWSHASPYPVRLTNLLGIMDEHAGWHHCTAHCLTEYRRWCLELCQQQYHTNGCRAADKKQASPRRNARILPPLLQGRCNARVWLAACWWSDFCRKASTNHVAWRLVA